MKRRAFLFAALAVVLGACATKYGDMGFTGGVTAEPVMTDVYRIKARGNAFTQSASIQDFVLLKAAETTIAAGGTHFLIVNSRNQTQVITEQDPGTLNTQRFGGARITTYTPGSTYNIVKPGQDTLVRVLRLRPGEPPPAGALAADDLARTLGARLKPS